MNRSSTLIVLFFLLLQLLIYVDRGIVPGCASELAEFIANSLDTDRPSMYLGVLQTAFIVGLSLGCPVMAHFSHSTSPARLTACGMFIWCFAGWISGTSADIGSFKTLLLGRTLSGVGEAAVVSLAPPLFLQLTDTESTGMWLGIFYALIPIGTALGFCYGSVAATRPGGWGYAFLLQAIVGTPMALLSYAIRLPPLDAERPAPGNATNIEPVQRRGPAPPVLHDARDAMYLSLDNADPPDSCLRSLGTTSGGVCRVEPTHLVCHNPRSLRERVDSRLCRLSAVPGASGATSGNRDPFVPSPCITRRAMDPLLVADEDESGGGGEGSATGFISDVKILTQYPAFLWLAVSASSYAACLASFSSFGAIFLRDLGLATTETLASFSIGSVVASAAVIGTLLGGRFLTPPVFPTTAPLAEEASTQPEPRYLPLSSKDDSQDCVKYPSPFLSTALKSDVQPPVPASEEKQPEALLLPGSRPGRSVGLASVDPESTVLLDDPSCQNMRGFLEPLQVVFWVLVASLAALTIAFALTTTLTSFLVFTGLGLTGLFASQVSLNITSMLVVPLRQRCAAVAATTLFLHATGDVPAPILVGLLKDILAPACAKAAAVPPAAFALTDTAWSNTKRSFVPATPTSDAEDCLSQRAEIRLTLLIITAWLAWMLLGVLQARRVLTRIPLRHVFLTRNSCSLSL